MNWEGCKMAAGEGGGKRVENLLLELLWLAIVVKLKVIVVASAVVAVK